MCLINAPVDEHIKKNPHLAGTRTRGELSLKLPPTNKGSFCVIIEKPEFDKMKAKLLAPAEVTGSGSTAREPSDGGHGERRGNNTNQQHANVAGGASSHGQHEHHQQSSGDRHDSSPQRHAPTSGSTVLPSHHSDARFSSSRVTAQPRPSGGSSSVGGPAPRPAHHATHRAGTNAERDCDSEGIHCRNCAKRWDWSKLTTGQSCVMKYQKHWDKHHSGDILECSKGDHLCLHEESMDDHFNDTGHSGYTEKHLESFVTIRSNDGSDKQMTVHERHDGKPDFMRLLLLADQYQDSRKREQRA